MGPTMDTNGWDAYAAARTALDDAMARYRVALRDCPRTTDREARVAWIHDVAERHHLKALSDAVAEARATMGLVGLTR